LNPDEVDEVAGREPNKDEYGSSRVDEVGMSPMRFDEITSFNLIHLIHNLIQGFWGLGVSTPLKSATSSTSSSRVRPRLSKRGCVGSTETRGVTR
jgi:hypothetical protein